MFNSGVYHKDVNYIWLIPYSQKFSPISPPALIGKNFYPQIFFPCVNDCIEDGDLYRIDEINSMKCLKVVFLP